MRKLKIMCLLTSYKRINVYRWVNWFWIILAFIKMYNTNNLLFMFVVGYPLTFDGGRGDVTILEWKTNFLIYYLLYCYYFIF